MDKIRIRVLVNNNAIPSWRTEHGLSLALEYGGEWLLFDTGAGEALPENLRLSNMNPDDFKMLILSHGHNDHTGGLEWILPRMPDVKIFHAPGIEVKRYSLHPGQPPHDISLPEAGAAALRRHKSVKVVSGFEEIAPGVFFTGEIERHSAEDCGGPFYFDTDGQNPDFLGDEGSLLLRDGILITGCCHAGIINTVDHCRKYHPEITIRVIAGGLHLCHASAERLKMTSEALNSLNLEKTVLLHCTGTEAEKYLKETLNCEVISGGGGKEYRF